MGQKVKVNQRSIESQRKEEQSKQSAQGASRRRSMLSFNTADLRLNIEMLEDHTSCIFCLKCLDAALARTYFPLDIFKVLRRQAQHVNSFWLQYICFFFEIRSCEVQFFSFFLCSLSISLYSFIISQLGVVQGRLFEAQGLNQVCIWAFKLGLL